MMATLETKLTVKFAWWVQPYIGLVCLVCFAIVPFLAEDDPTIDQLLDLHSNFICRFGVRCSVG